MSTNLSGILTTAQALIPGAYEQNTLTHRQPGSMGGPAFGSSNVATGPSSMDAATIAEREKEGGGGLSERRRKVGSRPQGGPAFSLQSTTSLVRQEVNYGSS